MPVTIIRKAPKNLKLSAGAHPEGSKAMCVMELSAYLVNGWTDHPACVSPVIAQFCRSWNDGMNDTDRQRLLPYAVKVLGTATTKADEETRAWLACDWLIRVQTPAWLRLAGLEKEAQALGALARISDATLARAAQPALDDARQKAAAAWAAAREDGARDGARDAARVAAWDAARVAAGKSLRPTVELLQGSAFQLLDAMIEVGRDEVVTKIPRARKPV